MNVKAPVAVIDNVRCRPAGTDAPAASCPALICAMVGAVLVSVATT